MNEMDLAEQTRRLAEAQEKFVAVAHTIAEASEALTTVLRSNRDYLDKHRLAFHSTEELLAQQIETLKELSTAIQTLVKASAESNVTINENSERMKALLTKVESYFGSTSGLDYDN